MITGFEDFCLHMFVFVDDMCRELAAELRRPGPPPECSDSELITIALISEAHGWDVETELRDNWAVYRDLFPVFPERSRYNRRRRNLAGIINRIRQAALARTDLRWDRQCAIDSLPIPVVGFHLAPTAGWEWATHEASFGKVASKRQTIFGYKLHMLTTLNGLILDFALAPAHATDLAVAEELLDPHADLVVLGDKGYVSEPFAQQLWDHNHIQLLSLRRRNQHDQLDPDLKACISRVRQIIETVTSQLVDQLNIERNHAHTFGGLCARLLTKLAAHTVSIYINCALGNPNPLQIKQLVYPSI